MRPRACFACYCVLATIGMAAGASDLSSWYAFQPQNTPEPGEIGMQDWLSKPAGRHGRITREADKLYYHGKSIKLWGINLCYATCAPEAALADKRAAFYPKYGINSVRLHKYVDGPGWAGIQSKESCVEYDPAGLDRMDYQVAKFKEAGIYVLLSAHFGALKLGPADKQYVPYLEEFGTFEGKDRVTTPHSAIQYSPHLQDVQIRQMVNLLRHKNPYTGLTYAQDPAVAFIEIVNEQSILFFTSMNPLKASPTLRQQVAARFCAWLRGRYGTHEKLRAAWGDRAFDGFASDGFPPVGEHLDQNNILPLGNPWYWDPAQLNGSQAFRRQRLLDTLVFLYGLQCEFYDRYVQAMREAGYTGEVLGSNWQAGQALSHFYNLHSDWRVGTIDRHNYFGGGSTKAGATFNNATMLRAAGSGTLSVGLQQAADRPFMLSEWIHVFPSEWGVEGPALLGAYGYGLQGWDVSYLFQNRDSGGFSDRIGRDTWDATAPQVLGIFPAVARQVLRGDVKESELRAPLYVHVPSLAQAKLGFTDRTIQQYDVKSFDTDKVSARAVAVARCAVEFTDRYRDTPAFDLSPFQKDGFLTSSTGQLSWKEAPDTKLGGYFLIDTPGTKAVVGFAEGQVCRFGEVTITPESPFAAIYVTAQEPDKTIGTSKKLLITALARARNTGMQFNDAGNSLLDRGKPPILLEPVKATITIAKPGTPRLIPLDHDGLRTPRPLPIQNGVLTIDGARDKTPYYLLEYVATGSHN
ncbi:MAG: glycoside hydrolase family 5 protein [Planctomycetes bacterium]|nr:glycoside hydrolase family 5 protein [Planctomycetota bacterium]